MPVGPFSYVLLAALAIALVTAAITDLKRREIDNWLNAAIALTAPLYWLASGLGWMDVAYQIGLALVTFAVACGLFVTRQMGGGDVKLLTALSLWFVPSMFLPMVVMMAIIGGGGSVALALFNMNRREGEGLRDLLSALAAGLVVYLCAALALGMAIRTPLLPRALLDGRLSGLLLGAILLSIATLVLVGMRHMIRRQKAPLPVPYGVAISLAGLWVLADRALLSGSVPVTG
jgi:prepilin peptidase CpaA